MSQPPGPEPTPSGPAHPQPAGAALPAGPVGPPQGWSPPQPGWPVTPPKKSRTGLVVGLVAGAVLLLCLCGGIIAVIAGGQQSTDRGKAATDDRTGEDGTPPDSAAALGQPVRDGKFEFVVKKVKCGVSGVGNQLLGEKAQGQFCLITLTIKNIGDRAQMFNDFDQRGYDSKGREYEPDSEAGIYANEDTNVWLNDINPGNKVTGVLVFDVPKNTRLTRLELHDSAFSGGVKVSLPS